MKGVEVKNKWLLKKKSRRKEITDRIVNIKRNTQIVVFQPCVPNLNKELGVWSCIKQVQPDSSLLTRYATAVLCDTICNDIKWVTTKKKFYDIVLWCYNGSQKYCDIKILILKLMCLFNKNKFCDIKLGTLILYILYIKASETPLA